MQLYRQNPAAEIAPLGQGLVILEPDARKFCALNATSRVIWTRMREPASLDQLADEIVTTFQGVTLEAARKDVEEIVGQMTTLGIVQRV